MARRGGIKRVSATIYDEARDAIKVRIETVDHLNLYGEALLNNV